MILRSHRSHLTRWHLADPETWATVLVVHLFVLVKFWKILQNIFKRFIKQKEEKKQARSSIMIAHQLEISKKTWKKGTGLLIWSVWGKVTKWWEFSFLFIPTLVWRKIAAFALRSFALLPQRRSEVLLHGWTFTRLIPSNAPCHMTTFPQLSPPSSSTKAWYIVRAPCGTNLNTAICLRAFSISFFHGIVLKSSNWKVQVRRNMLEKLEHPLNRGQLCDMAGTATLPEAPPSPRAAKRLHKMKIYIYINMIKWHKWPCEVFISI